MFIEDLLNLDTVQAWGGGVVTSQQIRHNPHPDMALHLLQAHGLLNIPTEPHFPVGFGSRMAR